uniref:mTERF family protein n=1 Tax=Leersia perrieri TaxID=77586 RepID=A0A0D9VL26_9ORYZ
MLLLPRHPSFHPGPAVSPFPSPSRFRATLPCTSSASTPAATAAASTSSDNATTAPSSFSVENYLITRCNLYPNVAARVAPELSGAISSPTTPDTVLAFLADALGLTPRLIAVAVARDPTILACSVPKTLEPRAADLRALGFTTFQMGLVVARCGAAAFRSLDLLVNVQFWLGYLRGRVDKLVSALKSNPALVTADLRMARSTISILQDEGGLTDDDIGWFCVSYATKLLVATPEEAEAVLARADEFGIPRRTRPFKDAIVAAFCMTPERVAWKAAFFRDELGWTEAQVQTAATKMPTVLMVSIERLRRNWEFLTKEVGMDAERVANFPALLRYDLDGRLVPRFRVVRVLQARRLWRGRDFINVATIAEEDFVAKFIRPFLVKVPNLAKVYESAVAEKESKKSQSL